MIKNKNIIEMETKYDAHLTNVITFVLLNIFKFRFITIKSIFALQSKCVQIIF